MNSKDKIYDVVVIGAGFAGLSTAWYLSKKDAALKIAVLEHDKKLGGHASGRNAGMLRQAVSDPILAALAIEGRKLVGKCGKLGWKNIDLKSNGSLLLANHDKWEELRKTASALNKSSIAYRWFSRDDSIKRVPLLENGDFKRGLFCESDATVEIEPLLRGFYQQLKRSGQSVFLGCSLKSIYKRENGFHMVAGDRSLIARKVVNAAGAWAGVVAVKAGASRVPLTAYRRHLFTSKTFRGLNKSWPFVWDLSHDFYFRPQGNTLLLSACDKGKIKNVEKAIQKENTDLKIEKTLRRKLDKFSSEFKPIKIQSAKSGLRTMTPDGRFVIGEDSKLKGFYWVAGLGGHGVTTSFSVGNLASDLILGRKYDKKIARALSPERFLDST